MEDQAKIEESHGLWEFAIVRLATMAELNAPRPMIEKAVAAERAAFAVWQAASDKATSK